MTEKTERDLIAQLKVVSAVRSIAAWIFCLSFLSFIGGGVCGIIGMCYGYRIAGASAFCLVCFGIIFKVVDNLYEQKIKELEAI